FHAINSKAPECVFYICMELQNRASEMEVDEKEYSSVPKCEKKKKKKVEEWLNFGMQALESNDVAFSPLMKTLQQLRKIDESKKPFYQMALLLVATGVNVNMASLVESNNDSKYSLRPILPLSVAFKFCNNNNNNNNNIIIIIVYVFFCFVAW
ncbi:myb domain-containing protein, partial [Reticulomyxa filosa]